MKVYVGVECIHKCSARTLSAILNKGSRYILPSLRNLHLLKFYNMYHSIIYPVKTIGKSSMKKKVLSHMQCQLDNRDTALALNMYSPEYLIWSFSFLYDQSTFVKITVLINLTFAVQCTRENLPLRACRIN